MFHNCFYIVNSAVTSCFRTYQRTTEGHSLTSDSTVLECTTDLSVLAIQVTDLTSTYTKVTSRDIYVRSDVTI